MAYSTLLLKNYASSLTFPHITKLKIRVIIDTEAVMTFWKNSLNMNPTNNKIKRFVTGDI